MSSPKTDDPERARLEKLASELRDATFAALTKRSVIAASLDESRIEVDRLLMLDHVEPLEFRRVVVRAQRMLDAWHTMSGTGSARG